MTIVSVKLKILNTTSLPKSGSQEIPAWESGGPGCHQDSPSVQPVMLSQHRHITVSLEPSEPGCSSLCANLHALCLVEAGCPFSGLSLFPPHSISLENSFAYLETPETLQFREFSCSFARTVKGIPRVVCSTLHVEELGWKRLCAQETSLPGSPGTKLSGVPILWEKVFLLLIGITFLDVGCPKLIANMFIDPF